MQRVRQVGNLRRVVNPPARGRLTIGRRLTTCPTFALLFLLPLAAVETKTWNQESMADFEKGTLTRVSLSSEGHLTLAPAVRELADASVTFLWTVARDSKGNLYAGGGGLSGGKAKLLA